MKKKILLSFLSLFIFVLVSGCDLQHNSSDKQQEEGNNLKNGDNNNELIDDIAEENINKERKIYYLENGEIDTNDWESYFSEKHDLSIKYPPFLEASCSDIFINFIDRENMKWHISFGSMLDQYKYESMDFKKSYFLPEDPGDYFREIEVKNGYIYTYLEKIKPGYVPKAVIFNDTQIIHATVSDIYNDKKYIKKEDEELYYVFIEMLESIEFKK